MAIAAMVNRSGLVSSQKRCGLDAPVAPLAPLAAMRRIVAADWICTSRALSTAPPGAFMWSTQFLETAQSSRPALVNGWGFFLVALAPGELLGGIDRVGAR